MKLRIEKITKDQLSNLMLVEAKKLGWLYSNYDVDFYFNFPQNQIFAVFADEQLAGCLIRHESISQFDNMPICSAGLFLVIEKFRGKKIVGPYLWKNAFTNVIDLNAIVCFHSVPNATNYYDSLGYKKTSLINLAYVLSGDHSKVVKVKSNIKVIDSKNFSDIETYNQALFPGLKGVGFCEFITDWAKRPDAITIGYYENALIKGYGIATKCHDNNYRISPLYADTPEVANEIVKAITYHLKNNSIYLFTLADSTSTFGLNLIQSGFIEKGKNFIVCNHPELIDIHSNFLKKIFCSIPLEYPHEVVNSLT